jgi:hypothetical protein
MLGKNIYLWTISVIFGGDIARIVVALVAAKFESVILHSTNVWNWATPERVKLAAALQKAGIAVYGGSAVYGQYPEGEGATAAALCVNYGLDGFAFDAELAFDKVAHPDTAAANLLRKFRADCQSLQETRAKADPKYTIRIIRAGWCWWAFWHAVGKPNTIYHPQQILWAAMAPGYGDADFGLPMTYWSWGDDAKNAVRYLDESWAQWRAITDKPLCPVGRAYVGDNGFATPSAVIAFEAEARRLGAAGVSWWSMQHALSIPGVWEALAGTKGFAKPVYHQYGPIVANGAEIGGGGTGGQVDFTHPLR